MNNKRQNFSKMIKLPISPVGGKIDQLTTVERVYVVINFTLYSITESQASVKVTVQIKKLFCRMHINSLVETIV